MAINFCALCNDPCTGANASIGNINSKETWRTLVAQTLCGIAAGAAGAPAAPTSTVVTQTPVTVTDVSTEILTANADRKGAEIRVPVTSVVPVYISFGAPATLSSRIYQPGDIIDLRIGGVLFTGAVNGIVASGSQSVEVIEL